MKSGAKIGIIVFAVLMIALAGLGVWGLMEQTNRVRNQPTPFELYEDEVSNNIALADNYISRGKDALETIGKYRGQIQKNRDTLEQAGVESLAAIIRLEKAEGEPEKDPAEEAEERRAKAEETRTKLLADFDKALAEVDAATEKANTDILPKMEDYRDDKIEKLAHLTVEGLTAAAREENPQATADEITEAVDKAIADARSKIPKYKNQIRTNLKKIAKIDEDENTPSTESVARKNSNKLAAAVAEAFPDLDLGSQVDIPEDLRSVDNARPPMSFMDFLCEYWDYFLWLAGYALLFTVLMIIKAKKPDMYATVVKGLKKNMMLVALVLITNIFVVITDYKLLLPANVSNVINQNAYIIILACGMLLCIVCSANIDLSVGRLMGFIAACAAKFMIEGHWPVWLAVPVCLLIGMAVGAWQGFWISYMKIPAFVVTLAGQLIFYGLTMMILQGLTINAFPIAFKTMFSSYLPDFIGNMLGIKIQVGANIFNVTTMLIGILAVIGFIVLQCYTRIRRISKKYPVESTPAFVLKLVVISGVLLWLSYCLAAASGLPTALFSVAIVLMIYLFLTSKTVPGRHLYAMGGNVNAARLSGVKTQKMLFLAYVNMGLLAALAGLVYAARLDAASPQAGQGDELYAIASCYIGGASAYGGIGTVGGALIGALTMGVIKNGMSMNSMGQDIQQIVLGAVLLAAVVVDIVSKNGVSLGIFSRVHKPHKMKAQDNLAVKPV